MRRIVEKLLSIRTESNLFSDLLTSIPRVFCGFLLAFDFGASKFGLPWSDNELELFAIPSWFADDVSNFGGLFTLFPYFFAWLAAASEAIGGLFLMLGLKTRLASIMIGSTMLGAIFLQQWQYELWNMLPALGFLWVAMYHLALGSGRFGLDFLINQKLKNGRLMKKPVGKLNVDSSIAKCVSVALIFTSLSLSAQDRNVTFKVNMKGVDVEEVGLKGSMSPLSWDKEYTMTDDDGDGIFEANIIFNTSKKYVYFKFTNGEETELQGSDNRIAWFEDSPIEKEYLYNEFEYYTEEQLAGFAYSEDQISEDVEILGQALRYLHPAIYTYIDSTSFDRKLNALEEDLKSNPSLTYSFKAISKFVSEVKCSHTFTNTWNQGRGTKKAIFFQPDKLPVTFSRIGKRLFIDKNASENMNLKRGQEILKINDISVDSILTNLAKYVTSDGNNYEKKLDRLSLTGLEKYSLFDVFYPLVFGSSNEYTLQIKDFHTKEIGSQMVKATSKTKRSKILNQRYSGLKISLRDGWNFDILNHQVAKLEVKSFAVHRNEFDWQAIIDDAIKQLNKESIPNLIVDIRENEGGQGEVAEYILTRVVKQPFIAPAMVSSVSYLSVPGSLDPHISTWDRFPYDFSKKVGGKTGDKYYLKDKYTVSGKTYKPIKNGYKGQVYLLTDASNSSATHLMASYAKYIDNITLVGQETGGNQLGLNGSYIFFLRLPNTGIEVDIPVINMFIPPLQGDPEDGGIKPDYHVLREWEDLINNTDPEIEKVLSLIGN